MKRCGLGAGLLLLLLLLSILLGNTLQRVSEPVSQQLDRAAQAALQGDAEKANALAREARAEWEKYWGFHSLCSHQDGVEEVDSRLAQLELYREDPAVFAASCVALSRQVRALAEEHSRQLWHFL